MGAAGRAPGTRSKAPPLRLRRQKAVPRGIRHFVIELPSRAPHKGHLAVPHGHASEAAWRSDTSAEPQEGWGAFHSTHEDPWSQAPLEGAWRILDLPLLPTEPQCSSVGGLSSLAGSGGPTSSKAAGQAHSRPDEEFGLCLGFQKRFVPRGIYWRRYLFLTSPASRRAHRCSYTKSCWFH